MPPMSVTTPLRSTLGLTIFWGLGSRVWGLGLWLKLCATRGKHFFLATGRRASKVGTMGPSMGPQPWDPFTPAIVTYMYL